MPLNHPVVRITPAYSNNASDYSYIMIPTNRSNHQSFDFSRRLLHSCLRQLTYFAQSHSTVKLFNMNKFFVVAFFACLAMFFFDSSTAVPTYALVGIPEPDVFAEQANGPVEIYEEPERADRHRRVTCDLFSVSLPWGSVNHAACAAHCIAMNKGYKGGRCIDGVCNCRR